MADLDVFDLAYHLDAAGRHDEVLPAALRAAVDSIAALRFNTAALRARAESFSRALFESRFRAFLDAALAENAAAGVAPPGSPLAMKTNSAW